MWSCRGNYYWPSDSRYFIQGNMMMAKYLPHSAILFPMWTCSVGSYTITTQAFTPHTTLGITLYLHCLSWLSCSSAKMSSASMELASPKECSVLSPSMWTSCQEEEMGERRPFSSTDVPAGGAGAGDGSGTVVGCCCWVCCCALL